MVVGFQFQGRPFNHILAALLSRKQSDLTCWQRWLGGRVVTTCFKHCVHVTGDATCGDCLSKSYDYLAEIAWGASYFDMSSSSLGRSVCLLGQGVIAANLHVGDSW